MLTRVPAPILSQGASAACEHEQRRDRNEFGPPRGLCWRTDIVVEAQAWSATQGVQGLRTLASGHRQRSLEKTKRVYPNYLYPNAFFHFAPPRASGTIHATQGTVSSLLFLATPIAHVSANTAAHHVSNISNTLPFRRDAICRLFSVFCSQPPVHSSFSSPPLLHSSTSTPFLVLPFSLLNSSTAQHRPHS